MKARVRWIGLTVVLGTLAGTIPVIAGQAARIPPQPKPIKTTPPKEFVDEATAAKQKKDADNLRLFRSAEPIAFTLTGDFKTIQNDRSMTSTKMYPATLEIAGPNGAPQQVELQVRTRGMVRRSYDVCGFAPLRLEFPKDQVKGTVFDDQHVLKLGVHCRDVKDFDQYVLREYAAYKIFNLISPDSFRARLGKATYVDRVTKKIVGPKNALFIENDDDLARRMNGRVVTDRAALSWLDRDYFTLMALFEFMIGNLDVSIITQHNVKLIQQRDRTLFSVPYDFDYSGMVDAAYALPPPGLKITTVRDRLYRGPCRTPAELEGFFARFHAIKPSLPQVFADIPDMDANARKRALAYLEQFYRVLARPADIKTAFLDNCLKKGLM